jgi:phosphopantothenoylcysteine decarboxylase/phosphopantothenate--cysteine ligase
MKPLRILIGITGSIAAYKSALLVRLLVRQGAEVRCILTPAARQFVTPLTLSVLSRQPVLCELENDAHEWNNHVELGLWADVLLIAPASAQTIGKMANGLCDNLLMATYLSAKCPVWFAPAMDLDMWKHPAVQQNIRKLESFGNRLIPVGVGELASGLSGAGRMAEPEEIAQLIIQAFNGK